MNYNYIFLGVVHPIRYPLISLMKYQVDLDGSLLHGIKGTVECSIAQSRVHIKFNSDNEVS